MLRKKTLQALPAILDKLRIDEVNVLNAYIHGSRLTGTFRDDSDVDIALIVTDDTVCELCNYIRGVEFDYDVHVFKKTYVLENMSVLEGMILMELPWIPDEFVLKKTLQLTFTATGANLIDGFRKVMESNEVYIRENMFVDNVRKNKYMGFNIRYSAYVIQILKDGLITNYAIYADVIKKIHKIKSSSEHDYEEYLQIYKALREEIDILLT